MSLRRSVQALTETPKKPAKYQVRRVGVRKFHVRPAAGSADKFEAAAQIAEDIWDELLDQRLNDGLPVVIPTRERH